MGLFSGLFGSSQKSKTSSTSEATSRPAPFTQAQLDLQGISSAQGQTQLRNLLAAMGFQGQLEGQLGVPTTDIQSQVGDQATVARTAASDRQAQLDQLFQDELDRIQGGPDATPEQQRLIGQIANERISSGTSDIQTALQESLGLLRSELAPSRGFRPEDTPIQDRGQVLARESLRLTEDLISQARADEARQLLDYPLQSSQLRGQQVRSLQDVGINESQFGQNLSLALQQFQDQLRTNDLSRRLAVGEQGLNLASLGPTNVGQFSPPGVISASKSSSYGSSKGGSSGLGGILGSFLGGVGQGYGATLGEE